MATKTKDIIEILRDDTQYYGEFGKQYLSNSDIGTLLKNPAEFRVSRPDNNAFAMGRYFHQLLLEPEKAEDTLHVDVSSRNSKAYKEFIAEHNVELALLTKECWNVQLWVHQIRSNFKMFDKMTEENNQYELPAVGMIKGVMWKGKADIVCDDCIIDLKTTSNILEFKWKAYRYNYDSQAYIYEQLFGKRLVFYVIDKSTNQLGIIKASDDFIRSGELKVERALDVYHRFFGDNPTEDVNSFIIEETL
jgi:hypothetical protein